MSQDNILVVEMRLLPTAPKQILNKRISIRNAITNLTMISGDHLTPELKLRLITHESPLWRSKPQECPFVDPFWAFYWAGGQALTRFILDNGALFRNSTVVDVGSGCGASSIAAAKAGAINVFANDIDRVACEAAVMNAQLNSVKLHIINNNILNKLMLNDKVDIFLVGDMFYDSEFSSTILTWLLSQKKYSRIFIGDPGRHGMKPVLSKRLKLLAEYSLLDHTVMENNGFSTSSVWELL